MTLRNPHVPSSLDHAALDRAVTSESAVSGRGHRREKTSLRDRLRRKRRENRHSLLQNLESRQLLAGPNLIGIQPNQGALLSDGAQLNVAPRELVFKFDDNAKIDSNTLSAIRITRSGEDRVFESATVMSDLGTSGQVLMEFRAIQAGSLGNGIEVNFVVGNRPNNPAPLISVADRSVTINVNGSSLSPTRAADLVAAVNNHPLAGSLIEAIQVSGPSQGVVGTAIPNGLNLVLDGANAAQAVTDFGTGGNVQVRLVSQLPGSDGLATAITVERRNFGGPANPVVVVTDRNIRVQLNSSAGNETTATQFINAINTNPEASLLLKATLQQGSGNTVIGNRPTTYSPLRLSGVSDVVVKPGYVGLGESSREVVFRFAEPLPDDNYQIDILGSGPLALLNVDGEAFRDGVSETINFSINLGPKILAVVPEPVRRSADGTLNPAIGKIEVHFNNDKLDLASAQNTAFYQLIFTRDTVSNAASSAGPADAVIRPISAQYNNTTNIVTLDFGRPLSRIPDPINPGQFLTGAARLRVGSSADLPAPPTEITLSAEPGDSFDQAAVIDVAGNRSVKISSEIFNTTPFELNLPGPNLPGTRNLRPDDPTRLTRTVPLDVLRNAADNLDGISVVQYNFAPSWLGDDPNRPGIVADTTYFNVISEQQKQRVREVVSLYSEYLGISFVEVEGEPTSRPFFSIAVGDLYGGDERASSGQGGVAVVTRDRNLDGIPDLAVMDFQDFDNSINNEFGGEFFRGAMFAVGQLLGYGFADDLPQPVSQSTDFIFAPGNENEATFPSPVDIVHGQHLYRPDSTDIDLYRFTLPSAGVLRVETIAERLSRPSLLDSVLRLYREDGNGSFVEIAQNDDYFSKDSLIRLEVAAGTYMVGVSASGNNRYDPTIPGTGFGGRTEGEYQLLLDFRPTTSNTIRDTTGVPLDGNADGSPGGEFNFWFLPADANNTLYVDKASSGAGGGILGTISNPYRRIDLAIAAASPGDTIRVLGNGGVDGRIETIEDNFSYKIGFGSNGLPLEDGASLDLPQGVHMIIDSGAVLKMSRSRIGVGSVSPLINASDSSLQILGTPIIVGANGLPVRDSNNAIIPGSVIFTSINDSSVGNGNSAAFTPAPRAGDWGGIDFRGDLDAADELRRNREDEGVFLNHVQFADMRYGGGSVSIGGRQVPISPIDMATTRPTIINSIISRSADAAMAATPASFAETSFTDPRYQSAGAFTPDYTRVGPEIHGNIVVDNSINGLFVRLVTRTGGTLERVTQAIRFDDTDIPHILTENLVIQGSVGGPIIQSSAPSSLLVRFSSTPTGNVPAGSYVYRLTNVSSAGLESAASQPTIPFELTTAGGIQLNQLPTVGVGNDFTSRRLYRATIDPVTQLPGPFTLVAQLNASSTSYVDRAATGSTVLNDNGAVLRSRLDASLVIDPGTVVKLDGARIEARFGGNLIAEGDPGVPVIFTSLADPRYGAGGTFDTNNRGGQASTDPNQIKGDWGGIYVGHGSSASIDQAVISGAGGATRIEGGFASFNPIEVHQAGLRLANSTIEYNAAGISDTDGTRVGRGDHAAASVFVRGATPIIIGNDFAHNDSAPLSFDVNSLNSQEVNDFGRSTGWLDQSSVIGNSGPLIQNNTLTNNAINGMQVRGGNLVTAGVWDDVDIVHVVQDMITVPNQHIFGGLRLRSDARGSLVVKFQSQIPEVDEEGNPLDPDAPATTAGIVVGGTLLTASDQLRAIPDRIGGALQVIGHPDFPVVLTSLQDDFAGAGFTRAGLPQVDTNNDGILPGSLADQILNQGGGATPDPGTTPGTPAPTLPTGPEVNRGLTIDNDVDINTPGYFEATINQPAGDIQFGNSGVTVEDLATGQILVNQNYIFQYSTHVFVGGAGGLGGGTSLQLSQTTITQEPTLVADDVVESRGNFAGPNGTVEWIASSYFFDGVATLFTTVEFNAQAGTTLGNFRVISYLDEDVEGVDDDILYTVGTPGQPDFRAFTVDGPRRVGFSHGGFYVDDGTNQVNATYVGWAADQFPDLITAINAGTATFSIAGDIDQTDLVPFQDPDFGTAYGPADITTAFAWDVNATANTSRVTAFLELLASDPAVVVPPTADLPTGQWNGITIREAASDRNVALIVERESVRATVDNTNAIPSLSQFLGELAPNEQSGDENRRLGFIIDGAISTRGDVDVYSFIAESGTEVWLDIDRTSSHLDSVVELIDANGQVLALSSSSLLAERPENQLAGGRNLALFVNTARGVNPDAAQPLSVTAERLPVQEITISGSVANATGGFLTLSVVGESETIQVPIEAFLLDPAASIATALETFDDDPEVDVDLGRITATLLRRSAGDNYVIRLQFDESLFIGRDVPRVQISAVGVIGATATASVREVLLGSQLQDAYSSNPKDAGMRLQLPGEAGTRNLYHVRVRSSNTPDPLDFATLVHGNVGGGLTSGRYELQIRLRAENETAGTQMSFADVRYATNGLHIIGQPFHSPLLGENFETNAPNDTLATAQPLGPYGAAIDLAIVDAITTTETEVLAAQAALAAAGTTAERNAARQQLATAQETLLGLQSQLSLLQSDKLAISFAGMIDSATDVDWYRFEIRYNHLTRDDADLYLSTIFDLDYADNFARSDMALYVFNAAGELILVGGDSNIADDLPSSPTSNSTNDLSRGSAGTRDPFIGPAELIEGTYYVAVSNQRQVPLPLDQFFNPASANPLLRLEPIDSINRIAEDRIGSSGGGTASQPQVPLLFDSESFVDYTLGDVVLYVNTGTQLLSVNPFTGAINGVIGNFTDEIEEIAFRSNGELFAYSGFGNRQRNDSNWFYYRVDTSDASLNGPLSTGGNLATIAGEIAPDGAFTQTPADVGLDVEAMAIAQFLGQESGFLVANRTADPATLAAGIRYTTNILYEFAPGSGQVLGTPEVFANSLNGAATSIEEVGQINTLPLGSGVATQLGITNASEINAAGVLVPSLFDGDQFTISDGTNSVTFEFNSGFTLVAGSAPIRDGDTVTVDGRIFEFDTARRLQLDAAQPSGSLSDGTRVTVELTNGSRAVFEFDRNGVVAPNHIAIPLTNALGQPRTAADLASRLANAINQSFPQVFATSLGGEIFFDGEQPATLNIAGTGVSVLGQSGTSTPGAIAVPLTSATNPSATIRSLARALRAQGISVSDAGTQLSLPESTAVSVSPSTGGSLTVTGDPTVAAGNVAILLLPTDTQQVIAARISAAVEAAANRGDLSSNVSATPSRSGRSLSISGQVTSATGNLVAGGVSTGGLIRGVEVVNDQLFAVDDNGGLYVVRTGDIVAARATSSPGRVFTEYVTTATDLVGIPFTGLRAGPISYNNGELRQILFGTTNSGDIYAFNTLGELQPIFAGGRSMISTGISGVRGLDFSTLGFNLWHTTTLRGDDPGHGINALPNGARESSPGGASLAFTFEGLAHNANFPTIVDQPGFTARQDGAPVENTYNMPGGAKGVIESNSFSLEGYAAGDQPMLYFNYFADNDGINDRLRVYVIADNGVEHLVASNSTFRGPNLADDEFDDPAPIGIYDDDIDVDVQQLFDNTGTWRQARVPLGEFAGQSNLSLRIEFSTNGTTSPGTASIRTVAGNRLVEGQQLIINREVFSIDFAPTLSVPAGVQLANHSSDPANLATVTIDGQDYVLTAGVQSVGTGQIGVNVLSGSNPGTTVRQLSAAQIAAVLAEAVRLNPPPNQVISGIDFSDGNDDPASGSSARNDLLYQATTLPYQGGNLRIEGSGRFGNFDLNGNLQNIDDVDLLRLEVQAGTTIGVDVRLDFNTSQRAAVRFFDAAGDDLVEHVTTVNGQVMLTAPSDGLVYIGLSGLGNESYDPRIPGTAQPGQIDAYTATIDIKLPLAVRSEGNVIEFGGTSQIVADPAAMFAVTGQAELAGTPIPVSRFMSASEVALVVQRVLANRFSGGNVNLLATNGSTVRVPALTINDAGPFVDTSQRFGDQFAPDPQDRATVAASDNAFEGIYLDDFIIGFAERGELATGSNPVTEAFIPDRRNEFPLPANPVSNLTTGSYQVEIRDASEYVASGLGTTFRTFDTNDRLTDSRSIVARPAAELRDGQTFSLFDGRSEVVFEFDLVESNTNVQPGHVRVPFTLQHIDPVTGQIRAQTAAEVASSIIDAINRVDVQSIINVPALPASGVDTVADSRINLFGDVIVVDQQQSLAAIDRTKLRGDSNRDRDGQGVILIESSRFLFNEQYGINISHGLTANVNGVETDSLVRYPRNLVVLNTENLVPGVVVQSNVLAFNGTGGLQIEGFDPAVTETGGDPLAFDRIINNTIIGGTVRRGVESPSAIFGGLFFEQGLISFADAVVDYSPDAGGSPPALIHQNPTAALGPPDSMGRGPEPTDGQFAVSLGLGGSLTLQFTDNLLTGSGDARPDLVIFETGEVESVRVEISRDGISFFDVGIVGGLTNTIDIDAFGFGPESRFAFVRLTDLRQGNTTGTSLGADIDAVGALSTVPVETFTAGGTGINIVGRAAPAILNNVISNSELGIETDPSNHRLLMGGNAFYRNTENATAGVPLGQFPQLLTDSEVVFVAASELVFAPAAGSRIIDSSIDSVEDRPSLTAVKNPLGLPPSPMLAPAFDVNGQLRVDDPDVQTPSGLGERVFKDRGASDRGDQTGPRAVLLSPQAPNLGLNAGVVTVLGSAPRAFEIQLLDGIAPADVTPGTGIDDRSVTNQSVILLKDHEPLIEGIHYRFGYNPSTNVIRLTPIAGVFEENATYVIRMVDASDAIIAAFAGTGYSDGSRLNLIDLAGQSTAFEYETGLVVTIPATATGQTADGFTFEIFDGVNRLAFELDNNGLFDPTRIPITIPQLGNAQQIAAAIAATVNNSAALNLTANSVENRIQLLGSNPLARVTSDFAALNIAGQIGTSIGFGIQLPVDGARPADTIVDGQTFVISRGALNSVTFEFDTNNRLETPGATRVAIGPNATLDQIADAIVRAVGGAGLGLDPSNAGFGRVFLGGDTNYSLNLVNSTLQQLEVPGAVATVPIVIPIDRSAREVAEIIAQSIDGSGLPGVGTSLVDSRVFVDGTGGVSGVGAVDVVTIRDEVGNRLQSNQASGRTELTIFVGSGFNYGSAPAPYASLRAQGGPRHPVDPTLSLGPTVNAAADAKIDGDDDNDGIAILGVLRPGFSTNVSININAQPGRTFYLDAWFDWNGNGQFETSERLQFGSAGTGRPVLGIGTNIISVNVPASAIIGETYARFRLSDTPLPGPTGDATSGEVEDIRLLITNNPFRNPSNHLDVNGSGSVTPIDAIQIINALNRAGSNIDLSITPPPTKLPMFPDVNADGRVTASDAFAVINALALGTFHLGNGEGEAWSGSYLPTTSGVLASTATVLGDHWIHQSTIAKETKLQPESTIEPLASQASSVFDHASIVKLDSIVDDLAADRAQKQSSSDDSNLALDRLFALL